MHNRDNDLCLELAVTRQCNMRCPHCSVAAGQASRPKVSSAELVNVIEQLAEKYHITNVRITGGEPLLFSGLIDVLKAARNTGGRVVLETNATLVTDHLACQIAECTDLVGASLDSLTRHGEYRKLINGTKKAINGIKTLVNAGCYTQIATTVMEWNREELPEIAEFACSIGARRIRLLPNIIPTGRGDSLRSIYTADYLKRMYSAVFDIADRYSDSIEVASNIPVALLPVRLLKNSRTAIPGMCHWSNMVGVLPDGTLALCASVTERELVAHRVKRLGDIANIYENSPFFQAVKATPDRLTGICGKCVYRGLCLGYCRVYAYSYYGKLDAPFPPCQILYEAGLFPKVCIEEQFAKNYEEQPWLR